MIVVRTETGEPSSLDWVLRAVPGWLHDHFGPLTDILVWESCRTHSTLGSVWEANALERSRMEKDWKVGDVVRRKGGGPDMCIARFETDGASDELKKRAVCEWFIGKKSQSAAYQLEKLEFVRHIDDAA